MAMKKLITLTVLTAATLTACVGGLNRNTDRWVKHPRFGNWSIKSQTSSNWAEVSTSKQNDDLIGWLQYDQKCSGFSDRVNRSKPAKINGINVKISSQCVNRMERAYFPTTFEGIDLVLRMFKNPKNQTVTINNDVYSTANFAEALADIHDERYAI